MSNPLPLINALAIKLAKLDGWDIASGTMLWRLEDSRSRIYWEQAKLAMIHCDVIKEMQKISPRQPTKAQLWWR